MTSASLQAIRDEEKQGREITDMMPMHELRENVAAALRDAGWEIVPSQDGLCAMRELIRSRWFLGSRRVVLRLRCCFDEAAHAVRFQETAKEVVAGLPPPTLSFTIHRQSGLEVRETRRDISPCGGGSLEYGEATKWLHTLCTDAGWTPDMQINPFNEMDMGTRMK